MSLTILRSDDYEIYGFGPYQVGIALMTEITTDGTPLATGAVEIVP